MIESVKTLDRELFLFLNNSLAHPVNDYLIGLWTPLAATWSLALILAGAVILTGLPSLRRNLVFAGSTFVAATVVSRGLKLLIDRPRPLASLSDAIASGSVSVHILFEPTFDLSMPSGHTTMAFTVATILSLFFRPYASGFFLAAFMAGLSRVYVGAHYPSDVLAGAVLGTGVALLSWRLFSRIWPPDRSSDSHSKDRIVTLSPDP